MISKHLGWILALLIITIGHSAALAARESRPEATAAPAQPAAPSTPYAVAPGDVLSVALTFQPQSAAAGQTAQLIQPGDRLALTYHFAQPPVDKAYRVEPGDELTLNFRYSPELSQLYTVPNDDKIAVLSRAYIVQTDGSLVMTGLPEPLPVLGKTALEIAALLREKFKGKLQDPAVLVGVNPRRIKDGTLKALVQPLNVQPILWVPVPPDGVLSLPLLPTVPVAGKTVQAVGRDLTERYRKLGYQFVTVNAWYEKIADERNAQLRDILSARSNPLSCVVPPGGQIALPLIPAWTVAGRSLERIGRELTEQYRRRGLDRVEVSVWLEKPRERSVRVMGEVQSPGVYPLAGTADLWALVARAGGFKPEADTAAVRVVGGHGATPRGTFSFTRYLEAGDGAANPQLTGDELIFVPQKRQGGMNP